MLMQEHYDFIVFENFYRAVNHNKDVDIISRFLTTLGYKTAILDVCPKNNYNFWEEVPLLKTRHQFNPVKGRYRFIPSRVCNYIDDLRWNWHLHKILNEVKGTYDHLYVGSYYNKMLPIWFFDVPQKSNVYFWGLRSFWIYEYKYSHSIRALNSFFLNIHHHLAFNLQIRL